MTNCKSAVRIVYRDTPSHLQEAIDQEVLTLDKLGYKCISASEFSGEFYGVILTFEKI